MAKMNNCCLLASSVAIALLASQATAATDSFSTYADGSIVGQSGSTPPWASGDTWDTAGASVSADIASGAIQLTVQSFSVVPEPSTLALTLLALVVGYSRFAGGR